MTGRITAVDPVMEAISNAVATGRGGHIDAAREHSSALSQNPYGDLVRVAITEVAVAIGNGDIASRT